MSEPTMNVKCPACGKDLRLYWRTRELQIDCPFCPMAFYASMEMAGPMDYATGPITLCPINDRPMSE